jgi:hypothetical protein
MVYDYLKRGIVAGSVAGLAYGLFMALVVNPLVGYIDHLGEHGHAHEHAHEPAVSAATTTVVSIGSGVLWGILLGAVFGAVYYLVEPSLPGSGGVRTAVLAGAGFLTVSGAPWLVLPPVAPGTEQAMATDLRLLLYGGMMVLGGSVSVLAVLGFQRMRARGLPMALGTAVTPFVFLAIPVALAPANGLGGVPTDLAVAFRWLVVFSQLALWGLLAGTYAGLDRWAEDAPSLEDIDDDIPTPRDDRSTMGD